jgi:hypothetical protein
VDDLLSCFQRNPDGSWTCVEAVTLEGPNGRIQVPRDHVFIPGRRYMGADLAAWLDERLRKVVNPTRH